ncbi:hypothetical protein RRG08_007799 [Elysia crispata]|uniref:Uncharacterized protein n=1 Tax=Elysia crispata TaxID=231223 RepID=A0AAE1ALT7_9GAST|nr:hypothetical protein RRG08_007799 [Elysia crispata]
MHDGVGWVTLNRLWPRDGDPTGGGTASTTTGTSFHGRASATLVHPPRTAAEGAQAGLMAVILLHDWLCCATPCSARFLDLPGQKPQALRPVDPCLGRCPAPSKSHKPSGLWTPAWGGAPTRANATSPQAYQMSSHNLL